jgi:hypothetical protein
VILPAEVESLETREVDFKTDMEQGSKRSLVLKWGPMRLARAYAGRGRTIRWHRCRARGIDVRDEAAKARRVMSPTTRAAGANDTRK